MGGTHLNTASNIEPPATLTTWYNTYSCLLVSANKKMLDNVATNYAPQEERCGQLKPHATATAASAAATPSHIACFNTPHPTPDSATVRSLVVPPQTRATIPYAGS